MSDQETKEQRSSETLTSEGLSQLVFKDLSEDELLEAFTGGGGIISRIFSQPSKGPLRGKLVRDPNGNLMKSSSGNLIVAVPCPLPKPQSSRLARSSSEPPLSRQSSSSSSDGGGNIYRHILDAT